MVFEMSDLLPQNTKNWEATELFLTQLVEILLKYIKEMNDRKSKILDFHHPTEMAQIIDVSIPDDPQDLEKLLNVCHGFITMYLNHCSSSCSEIFGKCKTLFTEFPKSNISGLPKGLTFGSENWTSAIFQPNLLGTGPGFYGWRVADCNRQHQHVPTSSFLKSTTPGVSAVF